MPKERRVGQRKGRNSFQKRKELMGYYFIMTDTKETEKQYFEGLKKSLPYNLSRRIKINVKSTKTQHLVNDCLELMSKEPQYAEPWIVFDRDQVKDFDEIIKSAEAHGINVGWSNPCIEIWFGAYFGHMRGCIDSVQCCRKFSEMLKKATGYDYDKADSQIYEKLTSEGDEERAIEIASRKQEAYAREGCHRPSEMNPATTVHELVRIIKAHAIQSEI